MKVTIFGATGRTGQQLVKQALKAGHQVTAYVRTPSKMAEQHENLAVVQGKITDAAKVSEVISGTDGVLSALGAVRGGPPEVMVPAAKSILAGMPQRKKVPHTFS